MKILIAGRNGQLGREFSTHLEKSKHEAIVPAENILDISNLEVPLQIVSETFFIKNEFARSMGFAELATRLGETSKSVGKGFANVYPVFVVSTVFSIILLLVLMASLGGYISYWYAIGVVALYLATNIRFLNYLEQVRGLFAMVVMIPLLFIDHVVCFFGSVTGVLKSFFGKKKPA